MRCKQVGLVGRQTSAWWVCAALMVGATGCGSDDGEPVADAGTDTDVVDDAQDDTDVSLDAPPEIDAGDDTDVAPDDVTPPPDVDASEDIVEDVPDGSDPPDTGPTCTADVSTYQEIADPVRYTPRWAFEPWISKDISDGADTYAFVEGFQSRNIPVGVVVIDSPWETHYNTFIPNPSRYPEFPQMVADLREDGVRTILWITQMVNRAAFDAEIGGDTYVGPSPNYQEGQDCSFFVNGGATYFWWKGFGAGLDFFNPTAVQWWRDQQQLVLDAGIAGWKLDFGDEYIPQAPVQTAAGEVSHQTYSEAYYQEMLRWGAHQLGVEEFVTMVRPYDESYGFPGRFFARPEHAPIGWVGDNRRDWIGLVDALDHLFRSADAGYVVIGSDIGGYLDRDDLNLTQSVPFDEDNFLRWLAHGSLTPFMQLHGRANLEPWSIGEDPDFVVDAYRYWAQLHSAMVPFWYSLSQEAYAGRIEQPLRPIGDGPEAWANDWRYELGEALLVAPIFEATGVRDVALPSDALWHDWWNPGVDPLEGGQTLADVDVADRGRIPVYVRAGAIIPMVLRPGYTEVLGWVPPQQEDVTLHTHVIFRGGTGGFVLHELDGTTTTLATTTGFLEDGVTLSRVVAPTWLAYPQTGEPGGVLVGETEVPFADSPDEILETGGYAIDEAGTLWILLTASTEETVVRIDWRQK